MVSKLSVMYILLWSKMGEVILGIKLRVKLVIMSHKEGFSLESTAWAGPCWDSGDLKCCQLCAYTIN